MKPISPSRRAKPPEINLHGGISFTSLAAYKPSKHLITLYSYPLNISPAMLRAVIAHELAHAYRFRTRRTTVHRYCRSRTSRALEESIADETARLLTGFSLVHLTGTVWSSRWACFYPKTPRRLHYVHTYANLTARGIRRHGWDALIPEVT